MSTSKSIEIKVVTPDLAKLYLTKNQGNRPMRAHKVRIHERILRAGRWLRTTDALGFSTTGRLINGQHRLMAIANTGISAELAIQYGLPDRAQVVIDRGLRRTTSDALTISRGKFAPVAAKVARTLLALLGTPDTVVTDDEILQHVDLHSELYGWLATTVPPKKRRSAAVLAALGYAWLVKPVEVAQFVKHMNRPANLPENSPVLPALQVDQELVFGKTGPNNRTTLKMLRCLEAWCEQAHLSSKHVYAKPRGLEYFRNLHSMILKQAAPEQPVK